MANAAPQFGPTDYEKAFDLDQNKGFACHTLAELFAFVTELLTWEGLVERLRLASDLKRVIKGPGAWWFRGTDSDQYPLQSGIFRPQEPNYSRPIADPDDLDRRLRHEYFQQTRREFHELASNNVWDLLSEMQHYRLPTRLLDWTLNLITAAFFAVYYAGKKGNVFLEPTEHPGQLRVQNRQDSFSPTIWILNPRILSGVVLGEYALNDYAYLEMYGTALELAHWSKIPQVQTSMEFGRPNWIYRTLIKTEGHYPVHASWTNPRLAAQLGAFTLQTGPEALDSLAKRHEPKFLLKVRLECDREGLKRTWRALQSIGVDARFLFPEREDLTNSIKEDRGLQ